MLWIDFGSPVLQRWSTTYRKQDPLKWFSKQLAQINPQRDHKPVRAELRVCIYFLSEYSTNCTRSNSLPFVRKIKVRLKKNSITMRRFYTHTHTHTHTHHTHTSSQFKEEWQFAIISGKYVPCVSHNKNESVCCLCLWCDCSPLAHQHFVGQNTLSRSCVACSVKARYTLAWRRCIWRAKKYQNIGSRRSLPW